jgi:phosphatidylserine synthase
VGTHQSWPLGMDRCFVYCACAALRLAGLT